MPGPYVLQGSGPEGINAVRAFRATWLLTALFLSACTTSLQSQPAPQPAKWTIGFWFWGHGPFAESTSPPVDVLFLQAGPIRRNEPPGRPLWLVDSGLPWDIPAAKQYWLVFRYEHQGVPDASLIEWLMPHVSDQLTKAWSAHLTVTGIQLDIDCPTGALPQYAAFLRTFRKSLPQGIEISITALLDWFRDGTAVADVVREVDEFVPQFYDLAAGGRVAQPVGIAATFDAARWAPAFDRLGTRYRIGISTFGRAMFVPGGKTPGSGMLRSRIYRDLTPLDIAVNPAFELRSSRNEAGELVLDYRAARRTQVGDNTFAPGDSARFILPTPDAVRRAIESAARMRGRSAGVVFFRWPATSESMVMPPDDVLMLARLGTRQPRPPSLQVTDGGCVAVRCLDAVLLDAEALSPRPIRYRIRSSGALEYILPDAGVPLRMMDSHQLELLLPAYTGRVRLRLGRLMTSGATEFTVEAQK
jgi:hypothetical protein